MAIRENLAEWSTQPFESTQHMIDAQRDSQYKNPNNEAYRQAVYAKIALSACGSSVTVHATPNAELTATGAGIGQQNTEAGVTRAEEQKSTNAEMIANYGPLSVAPSARKPA